jgi:hypothetical protein
MNSLSDAEHMGRRDGGVEEKKDDDVDQHQQDDLLPEHSESRSDEKDEQTTGIQAQLQNLAKALLGGCGMAIEAVSFFVQDCRWPGHHNNNTTHNHHNTNDPLGVYARNLFQDHSIPSRHHTPFLQPRPPPQPLSIAKELQKLATPRPNLRSTDIPKFLGEEAVYSFEDDNISCLSQHTLEEMANSMRVNGRPMGRAARHRQMRMRQESSLDETADEDEDEEDEDGGED